MKSTDLSCSEFVGALASSAPAPGGGGAAALVGAIGTALGNMVGSLTVGKPKFADVEEEIIVLKQKSDDIQNNFIELVAKDADVFEPLAKAYGLPKGTPEEIEHKTKVMEACLVKCAQVPLEIMKNCCDALLIVDRFEQIGTPIAISDVGCGALTLKAAILSADLNVRVNTKLMQDREKAQAINTEAAALLAEYVPLADAIAKKVQDRYA